MLTQPMTSGGGGAEKFAANLTLILQDQFDFVLVTPQAHAKHLASPYAFGGRLLEVPISWESGGTRLRHFQSRLTRLYQVACALREEKPDLVYSNYSMSWHALGASLRLARIIQAPLVTRFGIAPSAEMRPTTYRMAFAGLLRGVNTVIANSHGLGEDIHRTLRVPRSRIRVIHNPVWVERVTAKKEGLALVDEQAKRFSKPTFVAVGRLAAQKNHALLLRALQVVRRTHDVQVALIGQGPLAESLRALARELNIESAVHFLGWQEDPHAFVRGAFASVLSSDFEGFPSALIEAMACGVPVISTRCPYGPDEIIQHGRNGLLFPVGDSAALAECMRSLLDSSTSRERIVRAAQADLRRFDASQITEQYAHVFREALAEKTP